MGQESQSLRASLMAYSLVCLSGKSSGKNTSGQSMQGVLPIRSTSDIRCEYVCLWSLI